MPDVSGFDVLQALEADPTTRDIPILVVTAKDLTPKEKLVLSGHVVAVLQKGTFAAVELMRWLNTIVGASAPRGVT